MLIEKVKIENFGLFVGKHELEFSINKQKKLNLIIGPNGSGKTQLFNLMSLCLYGKQGTQFHEFTDVEPLFLSDSIANNLGNNQTAITRVEMNLIFENKSYVTKREVNYKKIDGDIAVASTKTKYSKYFHSIFPNPSFIFVKNIGSVIENFNQTHINSEKLDKVIQKMNLINQKSQFKYFANSEFRYIDNKIQLIGDKEPLELQAAGRKATLDFIFLSSIRGILIPNSVLIVDGPFNYITEEFVIPIYNILLEYLPQIIFLDTYLHNPNLEKKQGIVYELVSEQEISRTVIRRFRTSYADSYTNYS